MKPRVLATHETMSAAAARWLSDTLKGRPDSLFCLATGGTPLLAYEKFVAQARRAPGLCRRMRALKLDEWGGLDMDDPASCEFALQTSLVRPLKLNKRYTGFESRPDDPAKECARIAAWLRKNGPIDVCVLGLGVNGHLAFNEPAESLQPGVHVAKLARASMGHSMLNAARSKPRYGITLGIADILQSRRVLLLVSGPAKRVPLRRLLEGRVTPRFPASFLWLHPDVTLLCDRAATR
ncbi:MAG: 6-phosphogluconolactonase [Verrucomicrobia bacterium]|nr:6-phosphogluconolactonase [Verrucomicrobiota bacterium]MBI3867008.1 6-phosphogluconolactonase [Verrucomicrobiota bacterium]